MADRDWKDLGNNLNRIVEDAVNMKNFGRLNENINNTIDKVLGSFTGEPGQRRTPPGDIDFNLSGNAGQRGQYGNSPNENQQASGKAQNSPNENASGTYSNNQGMNYSFSGAKGAYSSSAAQNDFSKARGEIFAGNGKRKVGSWIMLLCGILLSVLNFVLLGLLTIGAFIVMNSTMTAFMTVFIIFFIVGLVLAVKGGLGLRLSKKFEQHVRSMDGEAYADIKKLATYCHRSEKEVLREIKKMMKKGWFPQGHLDKSEKCFMVTNEAYEQYLITLKNAKLQEEERRRKQEEAAKKSDGLTQEVKAVLRKGGEYIESIRKSNDAIPGKEISEKIYRMELLVKRIFQQTEAHPENVQDLDKLMEYYLPMTIKLLKAYEELDEQPVQGENILNSKKEIEDTLDTLNKAFERMLDNLFEDRAWDVSSDISVLESLLAQEGLTDDGFGGRRSRN